MDFYKMPLFAESWCVAFRQRSNADYLADLTSPFTVIENSTRYWAADPFLFEDGGTVYVFAELYDYVRRRGVIGYYILNQKGSRWTPVISESYHLSFPVVFRNADEIYILPESSQCSEVYLYRAVRFPDVWEKSNVLRKNVKYVDTTPFTALGKNLAFTYDLKEPCLKILDLDSGQDIVADSAAADLVRPAGLVDAETSVRAAQNCVEDYGKGLVFYRFVLNGDMSYKETEMHRVFPEDLLLSRHVYLDGLHTYNRSEHYEIIDIKTRRFNLLNLLFRSVSKIERLLSAQKPAT